MTASAGHRNVGKCLCVFLGCVVLALLCLAKLATHANAYTGINSFSATRSDTQAGGHPDIEMHLRFDNRVEKNGVLVGPSNDGCGCQDAKSIAFHAPTGFIGNPHTVPQCSLAEFSVQECAPESQVGVVTAIGFQQPVYNMEAHTDEAGLLAFTIPAIKGPAFISLRGRTESDYGLDTVVTGIYHPLPLLGGLDFYLWGVPASPAHDANRYPIHNEVCQNANAHYPQGCFPALASHTTPAPFLSNPITCGVPLSVGVDLTYYDHTVVHSDTPWTSTTGCDQLSFDPSVTAKPTTTVADTASGLDVDLVVPQQQSPTVPSPSEIRATSVTLPLGMSVNPNAADGKTSCTEVQGAFGTDEAAQCPEYAKIGTDIIDNVALPGPISGGMYLGEPQPGNRYRVFLTADGFATHVKIAGSLHFDPQTGQITTTFEDLPQTPTQEVQMHFFGSERGLLATPTECGTYSVESTFVPWDDALPNQSSTSYFTIDAGPDGTPCPEAGNRPFDPQLRAGSADNTGGVHSPFVLKLTRRDGEQNLTGFTVETPPGFSASLAGIPYCSEADIAKLTDPLYNGLTELATPACPVQSQIGNAAAGAGAGTHPLYTNGRVFLAGPYKGAPLSLVTAIPAVSGPYDLGTVAVRAALNVDPTTAQVTTVTDPLPQILDGIPLRIRSIQVDLNRKDFALNPTNCDPFSVDSTVSGDQGASANPAAFYQVANCSDLSFSPRLAITLKGGSKRNGHPALSATFKAKAGDANTKSVAVTLPSSMQVDSSHLRSVCTTSQFNVGTCSKPSTLGTAKAASPLLDSPLKGNIYLVSSGNPLPDLVLALRGQLPVNVHGVIDQVPGKGLRATFATVPDVPLSTVQLNVAGARKGLIVNNTDICRAPSTALARIAAQNGKSASQRVALSLPCGNARRGRHKRHHSRRHHRARRH